MKKCNGCRKEKEYEEFRKNTKLLVKCSECRENAKEWKDKNKQRIKLYNEAYRNNNTEKWTEIKKENEITDNVIGQPSNHRTLHETIDDIIGKKCCTCKEWQPLTSYNFQKNHWDKLRVECKVCLSKWRKSNRDVLNEKFKIYEKNRKETDPEYKLLKTLRSRLNSALNRQNIEKGFSTMELTGCELSFLKGYFEAKFTEGMTWENHGDWHIDHIRPCCSFDLKEEEEQKKCFHYTNLQPLWAQENLSKGGKYDAGIEN